LFEHLRTQSAMKSGLLDDLCSPAQRLFEVG
jgi:hypothetical protein